MGGKKYFRMMARIHAKLGYRDLSMLLPMPDWAQEAYYIEWYKNHKGDFIYTKR